MSTAYIQAVEKINAAALFFAAAGYQVTTSFGSNNRSMDITVFFILCDDKNLIESFLTRYEDENDTIEFKDFTHGETHPFYTLKLTKYLS